MAADKAALDITVAAGGNLEAVTTATITLPLLVNIGYWLSWKSNNTVVIAKSGGTATVTRPAAGA